MIDTMQLELLLLDRAALADLWNQASWIGPIPVIEGSLPPECVLREALISLSDGAIPLWHSCFLFAVGSPPVIAGSGGFKGPPEAGRVELGYGVAPSQRRRGIATAAVLALLKIAFVDPGVCEVYAETSVSNVSSRRVLQTAGFTWIGQRDTHTHDDGVVDQWSRRRTDRQATAVEQTSR